MELYFRNSSNDHFQLNSSHEIKNDVYTADGWTFEENKIYENAMAVFEDTSSMPFFRHVASLMPWKSMESIKKHDQILMEDLEFIKSSNGNFEDIVEENIEMQEETRKIEMEEARSVTRRPKKRGVPWTVEEHELFLIGLQQEGKGEWKTISRKYLPSKTPTQIASHAQKFEKRKNTKTPPEKRRRSINDITFCASEPSLSMNSQGSQPNQLGFVPNSQHFQPNQLGFVPNSQRFHPNHLGFVPNSQRFHPNHLGFVPNSQHFQPNQLDSVSNALHFRFQPNQPTFPLTSQAFQPNQFNFQQNQLGMNSQDFETNQFWNTPSYNDVYNNY